MLEIREPRLQVDRHRLNEIYRFAEQANERLHVDGTYYEIDPLSVFDTDRLSKCQYGFVAEIDGEIVGAVSLAIDGGIYANGRPTLDGIYVLSDHQGRGIASALLVRSIERFIELGKTPIDVHVESHAMAHTMQRFAEKHPDLSAQLNILDEFSGHA